MDEETKELAHKVWDYHHLNNKLEKADLILALGSHDTRVANRATEIFLQGYASKLMFSGGLGNLTKGIWNEPEADKFAKIAIDMGVPRDAILIENKSTNTGENIQFSYEILKKENFLPKKMILVQKPYMERRTYATFKKQWSGDEVEILVSSPRVSFEDYPNEEISMEKVTNIMIGDLQRIKEYPAKGFQVSQEIPKDVWDAYQSLVAKGFTSHMIK